MPDILFDHNYVVEGDLIALAFCFLVNALIRSTYMVKRTNLNIFRTANRLVGVAAACSMTYHTFINHLTDELVILTYAYRIVTYVSLIWAYICICVYLKNLVEMKKEYVKIFRITIYGAGILFTLLQVFGPIFKLGFYIDENLAIHQNYYTDFFRYAYAYFSISLIIMLFIYRKKFLTKMFNCLCTVMVICFGIMVFQAAFLETTYTVATFTFPIITTLFLFHYNSYDTETGTLDHYAFRQYVEEMQEKGKKFSMIFLALPEISNDKMHRFSRNLLRKNDTFFEDSCCFRLQDNRVVLAYQKENKKNRNFDEINTKLYNEFLKVRDLNDYYIVMMDSTPDLKNAADYISYCGYVEARIPVNTYKTCTPALLEDYLKKRSIYQNLKDIYEKDDLNDPRVKAYCQPVLNIKTGKFTTAEALMRLDLPEIGLVAPEHFIPIAEEYDFIHVLSKIILNKACQIIKQLEKEGYVMERVSINFSMQELHMEDFAKDIMDIIAANGLSFDKIAIELTETRNEKDFLMMKEVISELQEKNIKFYLDDFGTGYSNFERIIELPIDIIKFDRSLTVLASKDEESEFMVGSFSEIFKNADYQILFEGVEDERDEEQCIKMNAQYLQGYKYSEPIPMEQLRNFIEKVI